MCNNTAVGLPCAFVVLVLGNWQPRVPSDGAVFMGLHTTASFDTITRTVSLGRSTSLDTATLTYSQRCSFLAQFAGTEFSVVQGLETYDRSSITAGDADESELQEKRHLFDVNLLVQLRVYNTMSIHHWRRGAICSAEGELPLRYTLIEARLPLHISGMLPRVNQSVLLRSSQEWTTMHSEVPRTASAVLLSCARAATLLKAAKAGNASM